MHFAAAVFFFDIVPYSGGYYPPLQRGVRAADPRCRSQARSLCTKVILCYRLREKSGEYYEPRKQTCLSTIVSEFTSVPAKLAARTPRRCRSQARSLCTKIIFCYRLRKLSQRIRADNICPNLTSFLLTTGFYCGIIKIRSTKEV